MKMNTLSLPMCVPGTVENKCVPRKNTGVRPTHVHVKFLVLTPGTLNARRICVSSNCIDTYLVWYEGNRHIPTSYLPPKHLLYMYWYRYIIPVDAAIIFAGALLSSSQLNVPSPLRYIPQRYIHRVIPRRYGRARVSRPPRHPLGSVIPHV